MLRLCSIVPLIAFALLLVGCPPNQYLLVKNNSSKSVKVDFTYDGSGTLLPHFVLRPGESRRTTGSVVMSVRDLHGAAMGTIDISQRFSHLKERSRYYDSSTRTLG